MSNAQKLNPQIILRKCLDHEETLWSQIDFVEENTRDSNPQTSDIGSFIVKHGKTVKFVHEYFGGLEPRKCCLCLTSCKTTFNNIRLVRTDGKDTGIEEGAMTKTQRNSSQLVKELNEDEFREFHFVYLCASLPVLGAPEPPMASSPSPVMNKNSSFRTLSTLIEYRTSPQSPGDSGMEDQCDPSIVPAETLRELLMRAFQLSPQRFRHYEEKCASLYTNQSGEKILAEELIGQLSALENNRNPFYRPEMFMHLQGYDKWQKREFIHIRQLMKKFWNSSYPPPPSGYLATHQHVHADYRSLLERLIRYEAPFRLESHMSVYNNLLSSASHRLLTEFGLRYGIGEVYRKIVYLHYLCKNFDPTPWFIQHTHVCLSSIIDALPKNGAHLALVRKEHSLLVETIHFLEDQTVQVLKNVNNLFSGTAITMALEFLLELMGNMLKAKAFLSTKKREKMEDFLHGHLQEILVSLYKTSKVVAEDELKAQKIPHKQGQITPALINIIMGKIRQHLQDYKLYYQQPMDKYINITREAAVCFYNLLMQDMEQLCLQQTTRDKRFHGHHASGAPVRKINKLLLGLGYRLNQLDCDWSSYISQDMQTWRDMMLKEEIHWIKILTFNLKTMVVKSVSLDKYETSELENEKLSTIASTTSNSQRLRSVSTKSLTPSVNSAFSGLHSSLQSSASRNKQDPNIGTIHECELEPTKKQSNLNRHSPIDFPGDSLLNAPMNHRPLNPDTRSLDEDLDSDIMNGLVSFTHVRSCSSLPDVLSKSFDHSFSVSRIRMSNHHSRSNSHSNSSRANSQDNDAGSHDCDDGCCDDDLSHDTDRDVSAASLGNEVKGDVNDDGLMEGIPADKEDEKNVTCPADNDGDHVTCPADNDGDQVSHVTDNDVKSEAAGVVLQSQPPPDWRRFPADIGTATDDDMDSLSGELMHDDSSPTLTDSTSAVSAGNSEDSLEGDSFNFPPMEIVSMEQAPMSVGTVMPSASSKKPEPMLPKQCRNTTHKEECHRPKIKVEGTGSFRGTPRSFSPSTPVSMTTESQRPQVTYNIPVSGSLMDLYVMLQRMVGFGATLCQTFCQHLAVDHRSRSEGYRGSSSAEGFMQQYTCRFQQSLYDHFFECLCRTVCTYADNMLCMDLCGTRFHQAKSLVGPMLIEHLKSQREQGALFGCRHDILGIKDCFMYINKKAQFLCDRYEPITQAMCTRINNVYCLLNTVKHFHHCLKRSFLVPKEWAPPSRPHRVSFGSPSCSGEEGSEEANVYRPEMDKEYVMDTASQITSSSLVSDSMQSGVGASELQPCLDHLMAILRAGSRIMAYRMNLFVYDALKVLLGLRKVNEPIQSCLSSLSQFLTSYFDSLQSWLYPDCFRRTIECFWFFVVQDFEKETKALPVSDKDSEVEARNLLQAISHLLTFIINRDLGIGKDLLLFQADDVIFRLQLYAESSPLLINLYQALRFQVQDDNCSEAGVQLHVEAILQRMRRDLQLMCKCFSGKELTEWIYSSAKFLSHHFEYAVTPEEIRSSSRNILAIAQWLLDAGYICDADQGQFQDFGQSYDGETSERMSYPGLSIHSSLHPSSHNLDQSFDHSDSTPLATPRSSPRILHHAAANEAPRRHMLSGHKSQIRSSSRKSTPLPKFNFLSIFENDRQSYHNNSGSFQHIPMEDDIMEDDGIQEMGVREEGASQAAGGMLTPRLESMLADTFFQNSSSHFYFVVPAVERSPSSTSHAMPGRQFELDCLVEQCLLKKVSPDSIALILYTRRKTDKLARQFVQDEMKGEQRRSENTSGCSAS